MSLTASDPRHEQGRAAADRGWFRLAARAVASLLVAGAIALPAARAARAEISDSDLRFLATAPDGALFHQHKRLRISPESLKTGWVSDHQCYYNLDPVPALEVVFGAGRVRGLRIRRAEDIGRAWVEGASVQLKNVGPRAVLCLESESRALEHDATSGQYVLTSGPYMRKFLDGYFPMRVTVTLRYPEELLSVVSVEPFDLPRTTPVEPGRVQFDAIFEGRLKIVTRFRRNADPRGASPPAGTNQ